MFKKGVKVLVSIILLNLFSMINIGKVNAASASISVKLSSSSVIVGNTVTATVTVSSSTALGSWQFDVGYDTSKLQLTSSSFGGAHVADVYRTNGQKSASYTFKFKALKSGSATISIKNSGGYDINESQLSISNGSKTVTIMTQAELEATYSKNNYLKSLSVDGATLSPEFNKETLEYSIELEPETTSIKVNASKEDSKASITGTGEIAVSEGDNKIKITVTAENGNERTYVINAKVKELSPINVKVGDQELSVVRKKGVIETPANYTETTIKINNEDVPAFENEVTKFILVGLKDSEGNIALYLYDSEKDTYTLYTEIRSNSVVLYPVTVDKNVEIPSGYEKYTIKINEQDYEVYKLKKGSQFALIYGTNLETGKNGLYVYDSKEGTLQRYNNEEVELISEKIDTYSFVILIAGGIILALAVVIIILIILLVKNKKKSFKNQNVVLNKKDPREKK